ncbi:hypothetical protein G6H54_002867 [Listeria monocytogenes]|nr:hypothetical protein [Listeria monocytogenes]EEO9090081.1 hypothetical protein [Listeria monocytogenes]
MFVDDQIWSNSKFKLALKVQNASDSNEILKTPDAAEITLPGRSYLQVGNNEIYELFQSAWSGADYVPDKENTDYIDTTIYAINDLGQYDILTEDLSGLDKKDDLTKLPSELDAVIDHIHAYTEASGIEALPRPWLPPLPEQIFAQDLHPVNFEEAWKEPKKPLRATIGLLDQPELQAQEPLTLDLTKDGHVAVFSSPGFGKSTFLQSLVMDLARQHNPEQLHVYLLDFGTNGLLPLLKLPHSVDLLNIDDEEKLKKFTNRITKLIAERKRILSQNAVANLNQYEELSGVTLPEILVVLDNFDAIREVDYQFGFEGLLIQIAREGNSVGVHLVASSSRQNSMRQNLLANIKLQVVLYLIETNEVKSIVGQTKLAISEIEGRGLIKLEEPTIFQTVIPMNTTSTVEALEFLSSECNKMEMYGNYKKPIKIPILPTKIILKELLEKQSIRNSIKKNEFVVGLDEERVESLSLNKSRCMPLLVTGDNVIDINNAFKQFIEIESVMLESKELIIIDDSGFNFSRYQENKQYIYGNNSDFIELVIKNAQEEYEERQRIINELREGNSSQVKIKETLNDMSEIIFFIPDMGVLMNLKDSKYVDEIENLLDASRLKIYFVIGINIGVLSGYDSMSKKLRAIKNVLLFSDVRQQSVISVSNTSGVLKPLKKCEAFYIENKLFSRVKVAQDEFEEEN